MGEIWVREFTGGLDTRKMRETTPGGNLIMCQDAHINRGGEIEQRYAFTPQYVLPSGTIGLAYTPTGIVVFGSAPAPTMPGGVSYQRLVAPDGSDLAQVLSWDLYRGRLYVVALFDNGRRYHFFDGQIVMDWSDGRAVASFQITSGRYETAATGSFDVVGGVAGDQLLYLTVKGTALINASVSHTGSNVTTATAIANAINSYMPNPDYTAVASGPTVTITPIGLGDSVNGQIGAYDVTGSFALGNIQPFSGGITQAIFAGAFVNGTFLTNNSLIGWTGTTETMAAAIANAINTYASAPEYDATVVNGSTVVIAARQAGSVANGRILTVSANSSLGVTPQTQPLAGGADLGAQYEPGTFVRTVGSKMYSVSGSNLHFSGIQEPTHWNTDYTGAGFIDLSTYASGSEELQAIAKYNKNIAIFADRIIQIFFVDSDPTQNSQVQQLNNTGTSCPRSVTQYGDNDLFYLDESGLRSLRARDSSGAAATNDIGVPVDTLVTAALRQLSIVERQNVIGLIQPQDGRFWLIIGSTIFVFSFFESAKVSAWSTYNPGFAATEYVIFQRRVYLRAGDQIYVYGGLGIVPDYEGVVPEVWLPYLDAGTPTKTKQFEGIDGALEGEWQVSVGLLPTHLEAVESIAVMSESSFTDQRIGGIGESTHIGVRFKGRASGPKRIGSVVIHFRSDDDED